MFNCLIINNPLKDNLLNCGLNKHIKSIYKY